MNPSRPHLYSVNALVPQSIRAGTRLSFQGKADSFQKLPDEAVLESIFTEPFEMKPIHLTQVSRLDRSTINTLLDKVANPKETTEASDSEHQNHSLYVATLYILAHPEETELVQKTLAASRTSNHQVILDTLKFIRINQFIRILNQKNITPPPYSLVQFEHLQQAFFLPLLSQVTPDIRQKECEKYASQYCDFVREQYTDRFFWRKTLEKLNDYSTRKTAEEKYRKDLEPLFPAFKEDSSYLSKLMTPHQAALLPSMIQFQSNALHPWLNQFHPRLTNLLTQLAPDSKNVYLYKCYQNHYDFLTRERPPQFPRFHSHLVLMQQIESADHKPYLQITSLDDERSFNSYLIWNGVILDLSSGHYLYKGLKVTFEDGKPAEVEQCDKIQEIIRDLLEPLFGRNPNIGTGPSVTVADRFEQDRRNATQYKLFGKQNFPDFIQAARELAWNISKEST